MQLVISFILAGVIVYLAACLKNWFWPGLDPAEPPVPEYYLPLLGWFHKVLWHSGHHLELDLKKHIQYAEHPTFSWKVLHFKGMTTCDPEVVKHVTQTNFSNYIKGDQMVHVFKPFLGDGIFAVNGAAWKHQRNVAKPIFRRASLQSMMPVMLKEADILLDELQNAASKKYDLDIQNLFMRYTLDSFSEIGFGYNVGSLKQPVAFSAWFDYIQSEIYKRGTNPPREYLIYKRFNEAIKNVDEFVYRLMGLRRNDTKEDLEKKSDLLSRFLLQEVDEETGKPFSDKYIRDVILNFIIAGRDTTAVLLTWTFYLLSLHPQVEQKVADEIAEILNGETPTWENLAELKYLKAVFDETLRLYPPVPSNFKQAVEDDVLPNGYVAKKGYWVQFNAYTIHRLPSLWGPDVDEFKPERWLEEGFSKKIHPFQYFPFHAGPRLCLGMQMAFLEAKIVVCSILPKFKVTLVPNQKVEHHQSLTMPVKNGLKVYIEGRA